MTNRQTWVLAVDGPDLGPITRYSDAITRLREQSTQAATALTSMVQAAAGAGRANPAGAGLVSPQSGAALERLGAQIDTAQRALEQLGRTRPDIRYTSNGEQMAQLAANLQTRLTDLARQPYSPQVRLDTAEVREDLARLQRQIAGLKAEVPVTANTAAAESALTRLRGIAGTIGTGLGQLGLIGLGLSTITQVADGAATALGVRFNASLEQTRKGYTTLLGSEQAATAELRELQTLANNTNLTFPGLTQNEQMLINVGKSAAAARTELIAIGNATAAAGKRQDVFDGITLALTQMASKGRAYAEEISQINERGIPAWRILAEALHVTTAEAQRLVQAGEVTSDTFERAFITFSQQHWGEAMADQAKTANGALGTITDNVQQATATAFEPLFARLSSGAQDVAAFVSSADFQGWAAGTGSAVETVLQILGTLTDFIADNFVPILAGAAVVTVPLLVTAMQSVIATAPAMAAALWAATGPIGVLAVGVAALAVAWQNDFLGMRTATEGLLQPVMDLQQQVNDLTGDTERQAAGMAAVQAAWAAHGPIIREVAAAEALLKEQTQSAGGEFQVQAAMAQNAAQQMAAMGANYDKTRLAIMQAADAQHTWIAALGQIATVTTGPTPQIGEGLLQTIKLLQSDVPAGMQSVADDLQNILDKAAQGGTVSAQDLHTGVVTALQQLATSSNTVLAQWAADTLKTVQAAGTSTGDAYVDSLRGSLSTGLPNLDAYVKAQLSGHLDMSTLTSLLGHDAGVKYMINLELGVAERLDSFAKSFGDKLGGILGPGAAAFAQTADLIRQQALDASRDLGLIGGDDAKRAQAEADKARQAADKAKRDAESAAQKAEQDRLRNLRQAAQDQARAYDLALQPLQHQLDLIDRINAAQNQARDLAQAQAKLAQDEKLARFAYSTQGAAAADRLEADRNRVADLLQQQQTRAQKQTIQDQIDALRQGKETASYNAQVAERPGGPAGLPWTGARPVAGAGTAPLVAPVAGGAGAPATVPAAAGGGAAALGGVLTVRIENIVRTVRGEVVEIIRQTVDGPYMNRELGREWMS